MRNVNSKVVSFGAAILAGGKATRLGGISKAMLEIEPDVTMLEKIAGEVAVCGVEEIVVIANDPKPYEQFEFTVVPDLTPNVGPLGGIEAGLKYYEGRCNAVLFVPCDLPGITSIELKALISAFRESSALVVYAETGDFFGHPLCSAVHNAALRPIRDSIKRGARKVGNVWRELGAVALHFEDETPFFNVNTPKDVVRWREGKGRF